MFRNILIPVAMDHEPDLDNIIALARRLQDDPGKVTLVGVTEDVPGYVAEYVTIRPDTRLQNKIRNQLEKMISGYDGINIAVMSGKPGIAIAELAEQIGADLIIIGSHRPGVQDYFLGSTASRVVRRAPCAVLVTR